MSGMTKFSWCCGLYLAGTTALAEVANECGNGAQLYMCGIGMKRGTARWWKKFEWL